MAYGVSGSASPVRLNIQGYGVEKDALPMEDSNLPAAPYKIPPILWMFILLIAGYAIIRKVMED